MAFDIFPNLLNLDWYQVAKSESQVETNKQASKYIYISLEEKTKVLIQKRNILTHHGHVQFSEIILWLCAA
jgi:hypothetical protein